MIQNPAYYWMPMASFTLRHVSNRIVVVQVSPSVSKALIDVSWDGEFGFIIQHMDQHPAATTTTTTTITTTSTRDLSHGYVVDLGAFDGILSSNSYNFLQLGWNGLLVEATPVTFQLLQDHLSNLKAINPSIMLENVAISANEDGMYQFPTSTSDPMQNGDVTLNTQVIQTIQVPMQSIKTLFTKHSVPKNFDVLSIDVENKSWECVVKILALGYRPTYIIIETGNSWIHDEYQFLGRLRYNGIFWRKTNILR
jgi:FkbM family methyltransferase